jgi:hypothetical protein
MSQSQSVIEESQGRNHRGKLPHDLHAQIALFNSLSNCPGVAAVPGEMQRTSVHPRKGTGTDQRNGYTNVQFGEPVSFLLGLLTKLWMKGYLASSKDNVKDQKIYPRVGSNSQNCLTFSMQLTDSLTV